MLFDSFINEKINLRNEFNVSDEGRELNSLNNIIRNDLTSITNMTDEILNHDFWIYALNRKREVFSDNVSKIKKI